MWARYRQISWSMKDSLLQYEQWVDARLAPTNHERMTSLPWNEEALDWKLQSLTSA